MTVLRKSLHILVLLCGTSPAFGETLMDGLCVYDSGSVELTKADWAEVARLTAERRVLQLR